MLKLIVCCDKDLGIAKNNQLAWKNQEEMNHFKTTTLNHYVVMGRKTYDSIGSTLKQRNNIIFSRNTNLKIKDAIVTDDINYVLNLAKDHDVYVIGGNEIYKLFEPYYDELLVSVLNETYNCDTFFNINFKYFKLTDVKKYDTFNLNIYQSYKNKIMFGNLCASHYEKILMNKASELIAKFHVIPHLKIIQVGNDFSSNVYIRNKIRLANDLGIEVDHIKLLESTTEADLLKLIDKYNCDKKIHGILVQLPLVNHIDKRTIFSSITPLKDVDGFNPINVGKLWQKQHDHIPIACTAIGVLKLLEYYQVELTSKNVVILGRSEIVAKPLISLMLTKDATVHVCHSKTKNLQEITKLADILIVAIGKANFIKKEYLKQDAIVIDVGINKDDNNKLTGDVDFFDVIEQVKQISPVPNGVGKMTLIMLFHNLLTCYELIMNEHVIGSK